jgi:hypothetical protein
VRALGRALADGLIADDEAKIGILQLALAAMTDLERLHVMVLDLLANHCVVNAEEDPARGIPGRFEIKPVRSADEGIKLGYPDGIPAWSDRAILLARPQLGEAYLSVMATLQRHALVEPVSPRASAATDLGHRVLGYYVETSADAD